MKNKTKNEFHPKAFNGDRVFVHNYRKKRKNSEGYMVDAGQWEWGEVTSVKTGWRRDEDGNISFRHAYDVTLDREVKNKWGEMQRCLSVVVNDDGLQTTTGE